MLRRATNFSLHALTGGLTLCLGSPRLGLPSRRRSISRTTSSRSMRARCAECHTDGTYKGSFSLDTRETMLEAEGGRAGKSGESELIERVTSDDPEFRMPPRRRSRSRPREVDGSRRGSTEGAPWEEGFTFKREGVHGSAEAACVPSCRRPSQAANIRSTASSTPISPATGSRPPRRSTTRRSLAGRFST